MWKQLSHACPLLLLAQHGSQPKDPAAQPQLWLGPEGVEEKQTGPRPHLLKDRSSQKQVKITLWEVSVG